MILKFKAATQAIKDSHKNTKLSRISVIQLSALVEGHQQGEFKEGYLLIILQALISN